MPHSLTDLNTLQLEAGCERLIAISSSQQLAQLLPASNVLVLGGGSNMLFSEHYAGTILHNEIIGYEYCQDDKFHYLTVGGGENWHQLVMTCCDKGIGGLENLALIPGSVGAAPIQNIGAYGVELADVCVGVEAYSLSTGDKHFFTREQCEFGYRDSMFKRTRDYFITQVLFRLPKTWQARLGYGELQSWASELPHPPAAIDVANRVIAIRQAKLPDPELLPNAGSFFKNPVITTESAQQLLAKFPLCPHYEAGADIKLAAGWLIEQLGLKGFSIGGAAVHRQQALVLINEGHARADELVKLAAYVRNEVMSVFGVVLEPEVNFIAASGYSTLDDILKNKAQSIT